MEPYLTWLTNSSRITSLFIGMASEFGTRVVVRSSSNFLGRTPGSKSSLPQ